MMITVGSNTQRNVQINMEEKGSIKHWQEHSKTLNQIQEMKRWS